MAPISIPHEAAELVSRAAQSAQSLTSSALSALSPRHLQPSATKSSASSALQVATRSISALVRRQTIIAIPATYAGLNDGPQPGIVVAIVLGSIGGTILLFWLIYTCMNIGGAPARSSIEEVNVVRRSQPSSGHRRSRSRTTEEVIEVRSPRRHRERVRETIVMEESRRSVPIVEEEDDIVEVIEEHSPPPRRHSRRVENGYRNVDPDEFAGGDRPIRKVRRSDR